MNKQYPETPDSWEVLEEDERHSTISYFKGGYISGDIEIDIWRGTDVCNSVAYLTSHTREEVPDWANYIIEVSEDEELVEELFAETDVGAWIKAKRKADEIKQ